MKATFLGVTQPETRKIHTFINSYTAAAAKLLQLCPNLCDPMDCSLPRSSVHGIFQARVLEWGAIVFSDTFPLQTSNYQLHFSHL